MKPIHFDPIFGLHSVAPLGRPKDEHQNHPPKLLGLSLPRSQRAPSSCTLRIWTFHFKSDPLSAELSDFAFSMARSHAALSFTTSPASIASEIRSVRPDTVMLATNECDIITSRTFLPAPSKIGLISVIISASL